MSQPTLTGHLNYKGNQEGLMGSALTANRFCRDGGIQVVKWVVTDVAYNPDTDTTTLEFDGTVLD